MDLDPHTAQKVLDDGVMHRNGRSIWNVNNRKLYIFRYTNETKNVWHGYSVLQKDLERARQFSGGALWREMMRRGLEY